MGIEFNPKNLNASEIFAKLDQADGKKDGKVNKSIWNSFAEAAGGNKIKNFIEEKNAIAAIQRYLSKASDDVKQNICDYLGNVDTLETEGTTKTSVNQVQTKEVKSQEFEKPNSTYDPYKGTSKTETFENYGFTRQDLVGEARGSLKYYGYDKDGEFEDRFKSSTTEAERKKALKAKGKNGYSYVKAKALVRSIQEKWTAAWKNIKHPRKGNKNWLQWAITRDESKEGSAKLQEYLWNERIFPTMAAKAENYEDLKKYHKALADIEELESKYPNIMTCYDDLREMTLRGQIM